MMKLSVRFVLPGLLFTAAASTSFASEGQFGDASGTATGDVSQLNTYLLNLGTYLGYNVQTDPTTTKTNPPVPYQNLLDPVSTQNAPNTLLHTDYNAVTSMLAASFITWTSPTAVGQVVSSALNSAVTTILNGYANFSFNPSSTSGSNTSAYSSLGNPTGISVSPYLDQYPYQNDPVSQGLLNILSTPDYSYCMNNDETSLAPCNYNGDKSASYAMNEYQIMNNVLTGSLTSSGNGIATNPLPGPYEYFQGENNAKIISQLNVNSLITPLMYSLTVNTNNLQSNGLNALNDAQQAANFIRYVTGAVTPMVLPDVNVYSNLVSKATGTPSVQQVQAQATLVNYLTGVRTYAAQMSVGLSNLYYIMSKRIPISNNPYSAGSNNSPSSQALSEFNMATWRLFNPNTTDPSTPTVWINQINNSSPATVQKEMAVLLAEINYQMYLNRQLEERLLLTNSLLFMQNVRNSQPSGQLNGPNTGILGTTGASQ
jgi:intracellular multiplication protein IcmX